jgi:cytochrome o ubiquinol oxidase subunit 3
MTTETVLDHHHDDHQHHADQTDIFGFWIYIMSDCLIFAALFATFLVSQTSTFGNIGMKDITNYPYLLAETIALLCSSFTYGMGILNSYHGRTNRVIMWLLITIVFGLCFVGLELNEFIQLHLEGHGPTASAFLSAFFTLVGTHGFHVSMGLIWMMILVVQLFIYKDSPAMRRRLTYLGLFWAFLDIVWIFVFTIVYLMGAN